MEWGIRTPITTRRARQFVLDVDTPAPAFLVTSETAYPGWHAWVDGHPRALVTTNVAFRGLAIPAGKHVVKMRFDPRYTKMAVDGQL